MRTKIITILVTIGLIGFVVMGVNNVRHGNQKLQLNEIELKSKETQLIELNLRYDEVIKLQTKTEKEKQEKLQKIKELEKDRERLSRELQAKLDRKRSEEKRLAEASKKAVAVAIQTQTVQASPGTSNCNQLRSRLSGLGVSGSNLNSAITLAMRESSCNSAAVNAESGACGEFQSYPCGKWGTPGTDSYLRHAINYANSRYGSYDAALSHSLAKNWY